MVRISNWRTGAAVALTAVTGLGLAVFAFAQQPTKAAQHFSFAGKRPGFHEDNIDKIEIVVSSADSEGRMSLIESYWTPKFTARLHYHKTHAETFYIISGQVEWTVGGETHVLKAGDLVHIPPNTVHTVKVVGNESMHSLMIQQPGGYENEGPLENAFTAKEKKDPKVQAVITAGTDFNPVSDKGPVAAEPAAGMPFKGHPIFSIHGQRKSRTEAKVENVEVDLSSADSEGQISVVESDWLPGFTAAPHFHKSHSETFYVFSGKVEWTVGGEKHVLGAGDAIHIPANTVHSVNVLEKIHTLWIGAPGGIEEGADRAGDFNPVKP